MKAVTIIGTYIICGFLTFGYLHNTYVAPCGPEPEYGSLGLDNWRKCRRNLGGWSDGDPAFFGAYWPMYWLGRAAIEITK